MSDPPLLSLLLSELLTRTRVLVCHLTHDRAKSPNLKQGVENTNTSTHSSITGELRCFFFCLKSPLIYLINHSNVLLFVLLFDYMIFIVIVQHSNTSCCLFSGVFNLYKKFSEERLFTVITSGLLAAFYSLCTEIKTLYLANSLSAFAFLCACSHPSEN